MSRYIDADELVAWCQRTSKAQSTVTGKAYVNALLTTVDCSPTADVAPVRHGMWDYIATHDCFSCNLCKFDSDVAMKYCGGCGAKMDGEKRIL